MTALRRFRACAVVISVLLGALWQLSAAAQSYRFGTVRIGGGGYITGVVASGDKIYARTDVGGCYRWSGSEWIPLMDHLTPDEERYFGVDGMAVDPNNSSILYIAAGKYTNSTGDVWRSGDAGTTWTALGLNKPYGGNENPRWTGECLAVDPNNSNVLYAGTRTDGLWRRSGTTWTKLTSVPTGTSGSGVRCIVIDKGTAKVYVGVHGAGIYVSSDGTNFSQISSSITTPARMAVSGSTLYVTSDTNVHKYNGSSWSTISPNGSRRYCALALDPTNANNVAVAEYYYGFGCPIYYSTNGGSSWGNKMNGTKTNNVPWYGGSGQFSSATSSLVMIPNNPKEVWLGDWYQVWKTSDITVANPTWVSQPWGHEELVTFDLACPPSGALILNGCADNGGLRHTDIAQYPTVKFGSQETTGIDFCEANPNYVARVSSDGWGGSGHAFSVSTDQGVTWQTRTNPGNNGRLSYSATNTSRIVWIPAASGTPKYTTDGGWTWTNTSGAPSVGTGGFWGWHRPLASDRVNGNKFYIFSGGTLYRSTNGGVNFSAAATGLPSHTGTGFTYLKAAPGKEGELLLSLGNNGVYRSSDSGSSFSKISYFSRSALASYGPPMSGSSNPTMFVLGVANSTWGVYRSTDLGASWTRINDNTFQCGDSPNCMEGDRQVPGRVYIGSNGRGLYFLEPGSSPPPPPPPLPSGWSAADIGSPSPAGSTSHSSGTWTVRGGGADIWGSSDQFHYAYRDASGDTTVVARVESLTNTNAWAKAGVMIRNGTAANAQFAMVVVTPTSGVSFQWRSTTGGSAQSSGTTGAAPKWVRLQRTGNSFSASWSDNGSTWNAIGTAQTISMPTATKAGLAVTSHANGTLCTATMSNVSVTAGGGGGGGSTPSIPAGTVTVDGTVDSAWSNATAQSIANTVGTISSTSDCSGSWKALWDSTNLYVLVEVTDDDKRNDSTNVWEDDSIELYLDGNNNKSTSYDSNDRQYVFGWGDTAVVEGGGRSSTGVTFSKADPTTTSYRIEAKVPWGTLGVTASSGKDIGIDVHINDDDAGGAREGKRMWFDTTDTAWQNPSVFGTAQLTGTLAQPTNLALNKAATASSSQSGNGPGNAVDGSTTTRWTAGGQWFPSWWQVDLGASYCLSSCEILWEGSATWQYRIEVSADNSTWTTVVDSTANATSLSTSNDTFTATGRYVRVTVTGASSYWWPSFFECRVMGN